MVYPSFTSLLMLSLFFLLMFLCIPCMFSVSFYRFPTFFVVHMLVFYNWRPMSRARTTAGMDHHGKNVCFGASWKEKKGREWIKGRKAMKRDMAKGPMGREKGRRCGRRGETDGGKVSEWPRDRGARERRITSTLYMGRKGKKRGRVCSGEG